MIVIDYIPPNHAPTTFHRVKQLTSFPPFTMGTAEVVSFASEAAYLAGASHTWAERYQVPLSDMAAQVQDHVENWLVGAASGTPFAGGILVIDQMQTLENAKERVWSRVKFQREAKLAEPFFSAGLKFDANVQNITGAAVAAFMSQSAGLPYAEEFTLFDNSVVTLDANQMIAVGLTLANRNSQIYTTARLLRDQILAIESSETVSEGEAIALVAAITWPY